MFENGMTSLKQGKILGERLSSGVMAFRGVPYARPPLGNLRWRPAQPVRPWTTVLDCTWYAANATQIVLPMDSFYQKEFYPTTRRMSEDGLYLNVWTPAKSAEDGLPIYVWIHGGAFTEGAGSALQFIGEKLASRGVVVATINYRLGAFGFMAHPELTAEQGHSGNYGFTDMAMALSFLKENAKAFGGNPENITIDGQKFSGNAQYRKQGRIMHHGTLMFDSDLSVVAQALQVSQDKIESKGIPSVRSRVTTIRPYLRQDVSLEQFKALLLEAMFEGTPMEPYSLTTQDLAAVQALRDSRYATWEWNYGASPKWSVRKRRRVEGVGVIEVFLVVEQGRIAAADFRGDYFSAEDSGPLSARLMGLPLEPSALTDALRDVPVDRYFTGLTAEALVCILTQ